MNLININETYNPQGKVIKTVNARELHERLESRSHFTDWIKARIEKYEFIEGKDYIQVYQKSLNNLGGRPSTEYHLTINMAKELSMVENNERGRMFRQYFIDCEERLQKQLPGSYREAVAELLNALDREETQRLRAEEAERTKGAIQAGRQATLMQNEGARQKVINRLEKEKTALVTENEELKVKAQESETWLALGAFPWIEETFDLEDAGTRTRLGKYLSKLSVAMEIEPRKIQMPRYKVNVYHISVLEAFQAQYDSNPRMLPECVRIWR